ncbi:hypothetical protein K0M31_018737 [Melipona bicolor]|uniref:Uncharacterized protein n=1 Tax=Melipona bicolor TaxID=60889 RepID=A0AA40G3Z0_9HYME|nr:hypothetical protein K0M31_018737 [Melipona bicolor]
MPRMSYIGDFGHDAISLTRAQLEEEAWSSFRSRATSSSTWGFWGFSGVAETDTSGHRRGWRVSKAEQVNSYVEFFRVSEEIRRGNRTRSDFDANDRGVTPIPDVTNFETDEILMQAVPKFAAKLNSTRCGSSRANFKAIGAVTVTMSRCRDSSQSQIPRVALSEYPNGIRNSKFPSQINLRCPTLTKPKSTLWNFHRAIPSIS